MPADNEIPLDFPLRGLNVIKEFGLQPDGTTPVAVNVRAIDTLGERLRGGSRSGLSRLIPDQVNGTAPIQNLSILVTADAEAINTDYPDSDSRSWAQTNPDDPNETDPSTNNDAAGRGNRNPGRVVRRGGSGRRPVKGDPPANFCREYHVASGFEETFNDFTICSSYEFPYDFTSSATDGWDGAALVAPGPTPPSLAAVNQIIADASSGLPITGAYDDFTDTPE